MDDEDLSVIAGDLAAMRGGRARTVTLRRDTGTPPPAQTVRVELRRVQPQAAAGPAGDEWRREAILTGPPTLDIQEEDRFTVDGVLYRVTSVDPNRSVMTIATAEAVA